MPNYYCPVELLSGLPAQAEYIWHEGYKGDRETPDEVPYPELVALTVNGFNIMNDLNSQNLSHVETQIEDYMAALKERML